MAQKIKLFIYGSCVSRDFLEITKAKSFELVDYFARSSFASIASEAIDDDLLLSKLTSPFQRRMVERDLNKIIFTTIQNTAFDFLLIDLIDERFNLAEYNGSFCTISSEFKKNQTNKYRGIAFDSDMKFEKWKLGVERFLEHAEAVNVIDKVLINKVYWAQTIDNGSEFSAIEKEYIERNNIFLNKAYSFFEGFLSEKQFIEYPNLFFKAKNEHKWGVEPFHYIDSLYNITKQSLELIASELRNRKSLELSEV